MRTLIVCTLGALLAGCVASTTLLSAGPSLPETCKWSDKVIPADETKDLWYVIPLIECRKPTIVEEKF